MTSRIPTLSILRDTEQIARKILGDKLGLPHDIEIDVEERPYYLIIEIGDSPRLHGRLREKEVDDEQVWSWRICAWVATEAGGNAPSAAALAGGQAHRPYSALAQMIGALMRKEIAVQTDEVLIMNPDLRITDLSD